VEGEVHRRPGIRVSDEDAVQRRSQAQVHAAVAPGVPELVRGHRERREGRRRLRHEKAEAFFQLRGDEPAIRDVVREQHEPDVRFRVDARRTLRRCAEHDRDFALEIQTPVRIRQHQRIPWTEQHAGTALIHERFGTQRLRQLGSSGLSHERDVREIRRAVHPFVRTWQRRGESAWIHGFGVNFPGVQRGRQAFQSGPRVVPVIQCGLERARDCRRAYEHLAGGPHDDQGSVRGAVTQGRKPHRPGFLSAREASSVKRRLASQPTDVLQSRRYRLQTLETQLQALQLRFEARREVGPFADFRQALE
jgi:hypothetical protein